MNYLLIMRLLLGSTVLASFSIRSIPLLRHKTNLGAGRIGLAVLTAVLLYGSLLLASIGKMSYLSVGESAATLILVCFALEVMLQKLAKRVSRQSVQDNALRYYG